MQRPDRCDRFGRCAIDLCDKYNLNSFVHHGVRCGLALLGLFAALVCVRWPAKARKLRGLRYAPIDVCKGAGAIWAVSRPVGASTISHPWMPGAWRKKRRKRSIDS